MSVIKQMGCPGLSAAQNAELFQRSKQVRSVSEIGRILGGDAIDSWRLIIKRAIHSSRSHAITMGTDAGGARRNFAWHGDELLHPADGRHTCASTQSAETTTCAEATFMEASRSLKLNEVPLRHAPA